MNSIDKYFETKADPLGFHPLKRQQTNAVGLHCWTKLIYTLAIPNRQNLEIPTKSGCVLVVSDFDQNVKIHSCEFMLQIIAFMKEKLGTIMLKASEVLVDLLELRPTERPTYNPQISKLERQLSYLPLSWMYYRPSRQKLS